MQRRTLLQILCLTAFSIPAYKVTIARQLLPQQAPELNPELDTFLIQLCDLLIPDSDSPGAIKAGVIPRLKSALNYMQVEDKQTWIDDLAHVQFMLKNAGGQAFTELSRQKQLSVLKDVDAQAYSGKTSDFALYRQLKKEIGTAYYTTEIGMTQELRYRQVPGRWEACVPLSDVGRTWAT